MIYQLQLSSVKEIPNFDNLQIVKKGRFYYKVSGNSSERTSYLNDLDSIFTFEYDFKNKEIIGLLSRSETFNLK